MGWVCFLTSPSKGQEEVKNSDHDEEDDEEEDDHSSKITSQACIKYCSSVNGEMY